MIEERIEYSNFRLLKISGGGTSTEVLKELSDYAIESGIAKQGYYEALIKEKKSFPQGYKQQEV